MENVKWNKLDNVGIHTFVNFGKEIQEVVKEKKAVNTCIGI